MNGRAAKSIKRAVRRRVVEAQVGGMGEMWGALCGLGFWRRVWWGLRLVCKRKGWTV